MSRVLPVVVRVFGIPAAPGCPADQTWEAVTRWMGERLAGRFGAQVQTEYVDLFEPAMTRFPDVAALVRSGAASPPIVTVNGAVVSAGGKVSVPAVRTTLEALGLRPAVAPVTERKADAEANVSDGSGIRRRQAGGGA